MRPPAKSKGGQVQASRSKTVPPRGTALRDGQGQARRVHSLLTEACTALEALVSTLSIGLQTPVKEDVKAAHRRAHRMGRPAKIEADAELKAFVAARLDTLTFDQIATEVAAHFTPARRVSRSSIHRWWLKHR